MLAASGHDLTLWGRDLQRLQRTAEECEREGCHVTIDAFDVSERCAMREAATSAMARGRLCAMVWAAGLFDWAEADRADPAAWDRLLDVNLSAPAFATRLILPALLQTGAGVLVYIGSGAGRRAYPMNAAYVASKHGLAGLAEATWLDVRDRGIKVSVVSPGLVASGSGLRSPAGQTRPQTLLKPEDVASAVGFVISFPAHGCPTEITLHPQRSPDSA